MTDNNLVVLTNERLFSYEDGNPLSASNHIPEIRAAAVASILQVLTLTNTYQLFPLDQLMKDAINEHYTAQQVTTERPPTSFLGIPPSGHTDEEEC